MLDEYFSIEDAHFLDELRARSDAPKLAGLAERWKKDPRPWARQQILAYLELPMNCNGHQPLVKRLFKHAYAKRDDELLAAFAVAFDRLVRRVKKSRSKWDFETRQITFTEHLVAPRNTFATPNKVAKSSWLGNHSSRRPGVLFSYHTRAYLRRRMWRFFRRLGHQHPSEYPTLAANALRLYTDVDLNTGENILDSWTLLHISFGAHDALEFGLTHTGLKEGRALVELTAKPAFPDLWSKSESLPVLLNLMLSARARLVRVWIIQCLRALHKERLVNLAFESILILLEHDDDDVQQFGAEIFNAFEGLDNLPVDTWLKLLRTRNLTALQTICDAFLKHVHSDRLTLPQCVDLASERPAAIAKLGFSFLKTRVVSTPDERREIVRLASATCSAIASELTEWALPILGEKAVYERDTMCAFLDSLLKEARSAAWSWLLKKEGPAYHDAGLWARLVETPYDDLRLSIVDLLALRALPGTSADSLESLWCSVLVAVHRGGRQKSKAVRQIGDAIRANPKRADALIPVLSVAIRSVRPAEARAGLSSLVAAADTNPELSATIQKLIPELNLAYVEAAS